MTLKESLMVCWRVITLRKQNHIIYLGINHKGKGCTTSFVSYECRPKDMVNIFTGTLNDVTDAVNSAAVVDRAKHILNN